MPKKITNPSGVILSAKPFLAPRIVLVIFPLIVKRTNKTPINTNSSQFSIIFCPIAIILDQPQIIKNV